MSIIPSSNNSTLTYSTCQNVNVVVNLKLFIKSLDCFQITFQQVYELNPELFSKDQQAPSVAVSRQVVAGKGNRPVSSQRSSDRRTLATPREGQVCVCVCVHVCVIVFTDVHEIVHMSLHVVSSGPTAWSRECSLRYTATGK